MSRPSISATTAAALPLARRCTLTLVRARKRSIEARSSVPPAQPARPSYCYSTSSTLSSTTTSTSYCSSTSSYPYSPSSFPSSYSSPSSPSPPSPPSSSSLSISPPLPLPSQSQPQPRHLKKNPIWAGGYSTTGFLLHGRGNGGSTGSTRGNGRNTRSYSSQPPHPPHPPPTSPIPPTPASNSSNSTPPPTPDPSQTLSDGQPYLPPTSHAHSHSQWAQQNYPAFIKRLLSRLPHPGGVGAGAAGAAGAGAAGVGEPGGQVQKGLNSGGISPVGSASSPTSSSPSPTSSSSNAHPHAHAHNTHYHYRPTKDQLLSTTTSFWQRLKIRWKWFSIRSWRRFNMDDWTAFGSWVLVGNTIWIVIGTTTFVSVLLTTLNSLSLQTQVARLLSDYLTRNTGFNVVFEEGMIRPRWKDGRLRMGGVFVSRRPGGRREAGEEGGGEEDDVDDEEWRRRNNYTMFDLNIEEVEVTLSLPKWFDGKGLVNEAKVKGVRGVIDRRHVHWDTSTSKPLDPADFRHPSQTGDFELDSLEIEDFLVTVHQPGGQRPFNVSIFNAHLGPFRKRWMFYDMLSAVGITGQYDNCLFSLHKPQKLGTSSVGEKDERIKRLARFRIDGLPIEHAQYATGSKGPMSWITSGKLDAVLDIKFPRHPDEEVDLTAILNHLGKNVAEIAKEAGVLGQDGGEEEQQGVGLGSTAASSGESTIASSGVDVRGSAEAAQNALLATRKAQEETEIIPGQHRLARPALRAPGTEPPTTGFWDWTTSMQKDLEEREVLIDIDLRFRDLRAAVPLYTTDLSVSNNAFIRPIVAFMNANRTLIPIHCSVKAPLSDFDGAWTLFETGLTISTSQQIHAALIHHVSSSQANKERIRTVGAWGVQRGAEAVLNMVRTVVDPIHGQAALPTAA